MATVLQVAKASLQRILVQGSEADLEPDEYQDYIFALNNYMLALDAEGITLGFTVVDNLADEITVPSGALRGIIANLAIEVAPEYNCENSAGLVVAAKAGLKVMRRLGQTMGATQFPGTLPRGSGNEGGTTQLYGDHYYESLEDEILAETTGAISLETGTVDATDGTTPVPGPTTFIFRDESGTGYVVPFTFLDESDTSYAIPATFLDETDASFAL